ncbi:MAG: iron chelate uptake ABC transporter family permease subunit [Firmicutes bacterium]|nr:iron chelate uptake ABC transporter family permease subunit [Bacillota bacterium]
MQIGLNESAGRYQNKKAMRILLACAAVCLILSLNVDGYFPVLHTPAEVIRSIFTWFHLTFAQLFHTPAALHYYDITGEMPYYGGVMQRVRLMAMTFLCGALMALSGSIFQTVFRNPMAAPTMLGVSAGVNAGVLVLVLQFEFAATTMMLYKYIYCYIGAVVMLALVLIMGKISSGKGRLNIFDMLIVGAILSQIIGAVMTYYSYAMENDLALVYQQVSAAIEMDTSKEAFLFLGGVTVLSLVPMLLLRFSFNAVGFETDDSRSLGIHAYGMKIVTMILGTMMIAAAMIHCGSAGMISLVAPFIARGIFGAEFRRQFWGNLLIGGTLLVVCKDIVGMIPFYGSHIPLGTIVDFVVLPLFVVIIVSQRRIWS